MSVVGTAAHSYAYHVAMIASVCLAALSLLTLVVFMIVTRATMRVRVGSRTAVALVLAVMTGLLASLPFALASGTHDLASLLMREVAYASLTALWALGFGAMMARIVTGAISSNGYEPIETAMYGHSHLFQINPASGLPMNGALDFAGNFYGSDSRFHPGALGCRDLE